MSQVLFYAVTAEQYANLSTKNDNAIYFITDGNRIYKGSVPYAHPVAVVDEFPTTGEAGTLYIHKSTYEAKTYNGTVWVTVSLPVVTSIGTSPTNTQLPTAQAVKNYLDVEIVKVNTGLSGAVSNVNYDASSKSITVQKGAGDPVVTALTGFFDGVSFDGATGELSFTANGGTPVKVNLPVEQFLSAASYDDATNVLTLTLNNDTKFEVNLADLVDTYSGEASNTATVSVAGGKISASVNVSAEAGNILQTKTDGVYASIEWQTL